MPQTVICAVERAARAKPLVQFAGALSRWLERKLLLVSLIAPGPGVAHGLGAEGATLRRSLLGHRRQQLEAVAHESGHDDADCLIDIAAPARGLRVLAEEFDAAMIVLGTSGLGAFRSALSGGSVTRRLVSDSTRPLILLPHQVASEEGVAPFLERPPGLVCGVDGSPQAIGALDAAAYLARQFDSRLLLLSVIERAARVTIRGVPRRYPGADSDAERERESLLEILREALGHVDGDLRVQVKALTGDPAEALMREARARKPSIVAVGSRGRGVIAEALLGSVSRRLIRSDSAPVLISPLCRRAPHPPGVSMAELVEGARRA